MVGSVARNPSMQRAVVAASIPLSRAPFHIRLGRGADARLRGSALDVIPRFHSRDREMDEDSHKSRCREALASPSLATVQLPLLEILADTRTAFLGSVCSWVAGAAEHDGSDRTLLVLSSGLFRPGGSR